MMLKMSVLGIAIERVEIGKLRDISVSGGTIVAFVEIIGEISTVIVTVKLIVKEL